MKTLHLIRQILIQD